MGKWFLDFIFWIQGYHTVQTAHRALVHWTLDKPFVTRTISTSCCLHCTLHNSSLVDSTLSNKWEQRLDLSFACLMSDAIY